MFFYMEPPFNEFEERWFLAEILKHSTIAPRTLLDLISHRQVEPGWTQIAPPFGRSIAACQNAYSLLISRQPLNLDPQTTNIRRSVQLGETNLLGERTIQPRPPAFPSVNGSQDQLQLGEDGRPKKKRGRPSKEEHEQRVAEAALRGEVYPPPKKAKTPRPSLDATAGLGMPDVVALSNEVGPSAPISLISIKKHPQVKSATERITAELTPGAVPESTTKMNTTDSQSQPFTPTSLLPPPLQTTILAPRKPPSIETQAQRSADTGGDDGLYQSPFTSEPARPLSSSALDAELDFSASAPSNKT